SLESEREVVRIGRWRPGDQSGQRNQTHTQARRTGVPGLGLQRRRHLSRGAGQEHRLVARRQRRGDQRVALDLRRISDLAGVLAAAAERELRRREITRLTAAARAQRRRRAQKYTRGGTFRGEPLDPGFPARVFGHPGVLSWPP